jgi:hypothetical protein
MISYTIMACKGRENLVKELQGQLGNVPVALDEDFQLWLNCRRAWRLNDPKSEWAGVIQDDALLCQGFRQRALKVIKELKGDCIVSFYAGERMRKKIEWAISNGSEAI